MGVDLRSERFTKITQFNPAKYEFLTFKVCETNNKTEQKKKKENPFIFLFFRLNGLEFKSIYQL